jgi:hypothetical protein
MAGKIKTTNDLKKTRKKLVKETKKQLDEFIKQDEVFWQTLRNWKSLKRQIQMNLEQIAKMTPSEFEGYQEVISFIENEEIEEEIDNNRPAPIYKGRKEKDLK